MPCANGAVEDYRALATEANAKDIYVTVAADLLSLALLTPPGEWGRCRSRQHPTFWCAYGLWWATCRFFCLQRRLQASYPRPYHRCIR
ncbi:MAG: hypothetical protein R2795_11885 [Saprospiraceae bacterium]